MHQLNEKLLSEKINRYLKYSGNRDRIELYKTLKFITSKIPETVIFGGMVRDLAIQPRSFSSDVDLVCMASAQDVYEAIKPFNPQKNKFGGFRFQHQRQLYDIWAFEDTWAIKENIVSGDNFKTLLETTSFHIDAAFFHLTDEVCVFSQNFQESIRLKQLELNLEQNPSEKNVLYKAYKRSQKYELCIGDKLNRWWLNNKNKLALDSDIELWLQIEKIFEIYKIDLFEIDYIDRTQFSFNI